MDIVIPSRGRATLAQQATLHALALVGGQRPVLVVPLQEVDDYRALFADVLPTPAGVEGIAATREWIVHDAPLPSDSVLMLDDDLRFAVRRCDQPSKFVRALTSDIRSMVEAIRMSLGNYMHVGIGAREGGHQATEKQVLNARTLRVLAYDKKALRAADIHFTGVTVMEDFHVSLQLLRSGRDILVLNQWVSDQVGGSNAKGGCSSYRTPEVQAAGAAQLKALHPDYVTILERTTKGAWGGGTRTDVRVQWKKARRDGNEGFFARCAEEITA